MEHHELNMQLPRGWYQLHNTAGYTFRRHCLSSQSGTLQLWLLAPYDEPVECGEGGQELLKQTLANQDIHVGLPLKTGCEECAAGTLIYAVYKHIGGQREYWLIPNPEATVFACWQMGAMATAGMERHDIHEMLKKLHFECTQDEEDAAAETAETGEAPASSEGEEASAATEAQEPYDAGVYQEGTPAGEGEYEEARPQN